ncbi:uncharacterized protein LOC142228996 [Haematobia irritans]|uniref:uncharacterized protein LOC142228996 n=1 Tax=Haematobia irritans TaxID=7368 RepID=UPI003F4F50E8
MSEEQQQLQHQQQTHQIKSPKDANINSAHPNTAACKSNMHDMRNQEFVSRLMAATPPYLYSAPLGPNNFFFSDMLRSLVANRNQESVRNLQMQQTAAFARRPRKRTWSQHRSYFKENETILEKAQQEHQTIATTEKPLELTTHKPYLQNLANKYRKLEAEKVKDRNDFKLILEPLKARDREVEQTSTPTSSSAIGGDASMADPAMESTPPAASLPPQDLVLPPPPPVWYPPLYSPYGIDPLHFFIDLRVSGHIYDRKKENVSPLANAESNGNTTELNENNKSPQSSNAIAIPNKYRHGSAFTVPTPRANDLKAMTVLQATSDAINLSSTSGTSMNKFENYSKYYDFGETKENQPDITKCSANYMLQHLPRIYSQFAARDLIVQSQNDNALNNSSANGSDHVESDNKSDVECDADSDGNQSVGNYGDNDIEESSNRERDIDVEIIDAIKFRNDENGSICSTPDNSSITQID